MVTVANLKTEPPLWHEDCGRRPHENGRHNRHRGISGQHLGKAAHRLVANSLQLKADQNIFIDQMHDQPSPSYAATTHSHPFSSYQRYKYHDQQHNRVVPPMTGYPAQTGEGDHDHDHRASNPTAVQNQFSYYQPYAGNPYRSQRDPYSRSLSYHERNDLFTAWNREHPTHRYYRQEFQRNGGSRFSAYVSFDHRVQGAYFHQQGGYNHWRYQPHGAASYDDYRASWGPRVIQGVGRGYGLQPPPQSGNQLSALKGETSRSRRPPPPPGDRR